MYEETGMLTIGQFSKASLVSIKALHYYDKIGLLRPIHTDPWTGYRYYGEEQLPRMLMIQRLKRYRFSLAEIALMTDDANEEKTYGRLLRKREELLSYIQETEQIISEFTNTIDDYERNGTMQSLQNQYEIHLETTEPLPILSERHKMSTEEYGKYYGKLFERVAREKIQTKNSIALAVYHDEAFDPECSDVELGVVVEKEGEADRVIPAAEAVTVLHRGAYSTLAEAYSAVVRWIAEHGYAIEAAPYELYLRTRFDNLPPEAWETKIIFPVTKKTR